MNKNKYSTITLIILLASFFLSASRPISKEFVPDAAYISGVVGYAQSYVLSCESRSAVDLMRFWGTNISETNFFNSLPSSDNPNKGFVGNANDPWGNIPPYGYGVHAAPIAENLRNYGMDALAHYGFSFDELKNEIASGRPVIVWVIGDVWSGLPLSYTSSDGETSTVAKFEHSMILIGYDPNYVYLVNASNGATETHSIANFLGSWSVLGNQAVTADLLESIATEVPASPPQNSDPGGTYIVQTGDYLSKLGNLWGMRWQDIAAINGITYPYILHTGQVLKTGGSVSPATPTPETPPPAPSTPEPEQSQGTYTVQRGDYLSSIARKFGVSWVDIAKINNLSWPYTLYSGNVLSIPGSGVPVVTEPEPTPAPEITPPPSGESYVIQKGDYLVQLGRDFGISWIELATINNIYYPYIVYPGQVILIP